VKKGRYTIKSGILLAVFLSFLTSCTGLRPHRYPFKPISSPDEILRRIESSEREVKDLKGIAKVKVANVNRKYSLKEVIIVQRPSSLRMETLLFGQPQFFLTASDNRLSILSLKENRLYHGKVTPENLSVIFPIYMKTEHLFSILLGSVPFIDYIDIDTEFLQEENIYLVELLEKGRAARQLLWVEPFDFSVLKSEIYDSSKNLVLRVKFDNYERVNGSLFPMSTAILLPLSSTSIKIDYSEVEINTGVNRDSFNLEVPPGVEIVNLD